MGGRGRGRDGEGREAVKLEKMRGGGTAARRRLRRRATRHLFTAPTVLKCGGRGRRGEEARQGSCLTLCDSRCCDGEPLGCFLRSLVPLPVVRARPLAAARPPGGVSFPPFVRCQMQKMKHYPRVSQMALPSTRPPRASCRSLCGVPRAVGRRRGGRQEERKKEGATHSGESGRSHFIVAFVAIPAVGADYRIGVRILILA